MAIIKHECLAGIWNNGKMVEAVNDDSYPVGLANDHEGRERWLPVIKIRRWEALVARAIRTKTTDWRIQPHQERDINNTLDKMCSKNRMNFDNQLRFGDLNK